MTNAGMRGLVTALCLFSTVATAGGAEWFLLSRHGECAPLTVLGRKNPAWGQVKDPYQFIDTMRRAGHDPAVREHDTEKGKAVEVEVPAVELFVMFVERTACRAFIDRGR